MKTLSAVVLIVAASALFSQEAVTPPSPDSQKLQILASPPAMYPLEAMKQGVHGEVVLHVTVNEVGEPVNAEVVSGDPSLTPAALEAVKRWKFQPFIRDGKPIRVASNVTVPFTNFRVRVSQGVLEGLSPKKVPPQYPPNARQAGIQGSVVLMIVVGSDGAVKELKPISGHPTLIPAAMDAVRQWHYRPYYLNGVAIDVESQVTINFALQR